MKTFGLLGHRLGYSFSRNFFTEKFSQENLTDCEYINFELDSIDKFPAIFKQNRQIYGLNCTIPYKQQIISYLDEVDAEAAAVGAVNTIKIIRRPDRVLLKGFNTDIYGFEHSLRPLLKEHHKRALILGTGGAARAVKYILTRLKIGYLLVTTKQLPAEGEIPYEYINEEILRNYPVIINTTPLGTFPKVETCPDLPYHDLTENHLLYDLVYNPEETLFLKKGKERGATVKNGLEMLHLQALKAWEIWNS